MAYPRSFLGLLLTGFTLVAAPLVGALAYSAWHTERLAEQSRKAVFSASQAARASRSLVNRIGSIERLAQQLAVLEAPEISADYVRVHDSFKQVSDELLLLPLEARQLDALKRAVAQEQALYEVLMAKPRRRLETRQVSRLTGELAENAYEVLAVSSLTADREVARLRGDAESVQRVLNAMSRWNDRVQDWIFDPRRLAPEFPESAITRPCTVKAVYFVAAVPPVDAAPAAMLLRR